MVMADTEDMLFDLLPAAQAGFRGRLRLIRPDQWGWATPCPDWTVRRLVNHVVLAEQSYTLLLCGGTGEQFLALQSQDALGDDPLAAYDRSAAECLRGFGRPDVLDRVVDYPLGAIPGRQLLALRLTETVVHTWDLASAIGADDRLDPGLVEWIYGNLSRIYDNVSGGPVSGGPVSGGPLGIDSPAQHRFFAAPPGSLPADASAQSRLLHLMGRTPRALRLSPDPQAPS